jgi:hypothetical protein
MIVPKYVCFIDTFTMCNRKQKFRLHTQTSTVSAYIMSNLFSCVSCFVVSDVKNKFLIALLFVERLLAAVHDRLRVVCVFACLLFFGEGCFIFCVSSYVFKGISFVNMLYESPRRKPGWRFTAGFELFFLMFHKIISLFLGVCYPEFFLFCKIFPNSFE